MSRRAVRFPAGLLAPVALLALVAPGALAAGSVCYATPAGHVCAYDTGSDGVPERVYLVDLDDRGRLAFDAWHRPGFDAASVGASDPLPVVNTGRESASFARYDRNSDARAERTDARVEAVLPSNIGGYATMTATDASSNGLPEHVDFFLFTTHAGTRYQRVSLGLP